MIKRKIGILALVMVILLTACQTGPVTNSENTITDASGRQLEIAENADELTISSAYAVSVPFLLALDLTDRVDGINLKSKLWTADPNLDEADSVGRGVVDLEKLAELDSDTLIHRIGDSDTIEAVENLGIEVLTIEAENYDQLITTIENMGAFYGADEKADEVIHMLNDKFDHIEDLVAQIPEEERVTAIVLGSEPGKAATADMMQTWMLDKAGAITAVDGLQGSEVWPNIGVETVLSLDPEVIFLTGSSAMEYSVDDLLSDPAWQATKAVKSGRVYQMPAKIDGWDLPGVNVAMGTYYMVYMLYPDLITTEEMQAEVDAYYTYIFGQTFDKDFLGYDLERQP